MAKRAARKATKVRKSRNPTESKKPNILVIWGDDIGIATSVAIREG